MNEEKIKTICHSSVAFFEDTKDERGYRQMARFPKGSCEVASGFLANALSILFPSSNVEVIRATSHSRLRMHFWVEIDGWAIDPTIQQFPLFKEPIGCPAPSSAQKFFCEINRVPLVEGVANLKELGIDQHFIAEVTQILASKIREALDTGNSSKK